VAEKAFASRLKLAIELFSVTTGIAFVVSGILNGLTFWAAWKLNYYSIASPSDIIMSGFILISMVTVMALVVATFTKAILWLNQEDWIKQETISDGLTPEQLEGLASKARLSPPDVERLREAIAVARHQMIDRKFKHYVWSAMGIVLATYAATQAVIGGPSLGVFQAIVSRPFWYETGLNVIDRAGDYPCDGAHVAWLGSSAAVLECRGGIRVVHNLDELQTVRRYR